MNNTVIKSYDSNIQNNLCLPFTIINNINSSYNGNGDPCMDKTEKSNIIQYEYDNNIVSVERHFTDNIHINDVIKKYLIDQQKNFILHKSDERCYNGHSNIAVVDCSEGRNK